MMYAQTNAAIMQQRNKTGDKMFDLTVLKKLNGEKGNTHKPVSQYELQRAINANKRKKKT